MSEVVRYLGEGGFKRCFPPSYPLPPLSFGSFLQTPQRRVQTPRPHGVRADCPSLSPQPAPYCRAVGPWRPFSRPREGRSPARPREMSPGQPDKASKPGRGPASALVTAALQKPVPQPQGSPGVTRCTPLGRTCLQRAEPCRASWEGPVVSDLRSGGPQRKRAASFPSKRILEFTRHSVAWTGAGWRPSAGLGDIS